MKPVILSIRRRDGVAGQYALDAHVEYPVGEAGRPLRTTVSFIGTSFGEPGPVLMVADSGMQVWVDDPGRYGDRLNKGWVRRFFARR